MLFTKGLLLAFLLLPRTGHAEDQSPSPSYQTESDVLYRTGAGLNEYAKERCRLDVYHPADHKDFATVVWFHGGGLTGGNRSVPEGLKQQGIAIVAANYRLSPQAKSPAAASERSCRRASSAASVWGGTGR